MARSGWARTLAAAALLTLLGATGALAQVCPLPPWTAGPTFGTDAYGVAVTNAAGLIYAAGGYSFSAAGNVNQFKSYNPVTNTWTTLANLPTATAISSLVYDAVGGRLFLFGGNTAPATVTNITQVYTIATNIWAPGPNMPDFRSFMASGVLPNGMMHLVSGYSTGNISPAFNTNWQFNPVTLTFTTKAVLPATLGGAAAAVSGGRLYVMGGRTDLNAIVNSNYEYDPVADVWATKATLPTAVNVAGGAALSGTPACQGDVIVAGGGTPFEGIEAFPDPARTPNALSVTQLYDVATNTWSAGPNMTSSRAFVNSTQAADTLLVVGGYNGSTTVNSTDRIAGPPLPVSLSGFTVE